MSPLGVMRPMWFVSSNVSELNSVAPSVNHTLPSGPG